MLSVHYTGVRNGEVVVSTPGNKQLQGTRFQVFGANLPLNSTDLVFPPSMRSVQTLTREKVRDLYRAVPFFSEMTVDQKIDYLNNTSKSYSNSYYLDDADIKVRVFTLTGAKVFQKKRSGVVFHVPEEEITRVTSDNPYDKDGLWPIKDVLALFKTPTGKRALVFRPNVWMIDTSKPKLGTDKITVTVEGEVKRGTSLQFVDFPKFAVEVPPSSFYDSTELLDELDPDRQVRDTLSWFTPSLHKSLIQKIVRVRPTVITHGDVRLNPVRCLKVSFLMLLNSSGSFVPNIQKYVTGFESATKRLAVSIFEDGYHTDSTTLLSLLVCSLYNRHEKQWRPERSLVERWLSVAEESMQPNHYLYDWKNVSPYVKQTAGVSPLLLSAHLLETIKSFQTDVNMLYSIAANGGAMVTGQDRAVTMPLYHCIDHHNIPNIVYMLQEKYRSFPEMTQAIWNDVTGINTRKRSFYREDEVKDITRAQLLTWQLHSNSKNKTYREIPIRDGLYNYRTTLSDSTLAVLVGVNTFTYDRKKASVLINPENIHQMRAIYLPSRGDDEIPEMLAEDEQHYTLQLAKALDHGYQVFKTPPSLSAYRNIVVYCRNGIYYVKPVGWEQLVPWEQYKHIDYHVPVTALFSPALKVAVNYTGKGMCSNLAKELRNSLDRMSKAAKQRLPIFLNTYESKVSLYAISRTGESQELTARIEDVEIYQFFVELCTKMPGVLVMRPNHFKVLLSDIFWAVRDYCLGYVSKHSRSEDYWMVKDIDTRKPRDYQRESIQELQKRITEGKRKSLLVLEMGLGKTLIVNKIIHWLIQTRDMDKYVIFTVPNSAITSIKTEMDLSGLSWCHVDTNMTRQPGTVPYYQPYMVNIIEHDHTKKIDLDVLPSSFLVVDEIHKVFNATQRTSNIYAMSEMARTFIGMTGTLMPGNDLKMFLKWVSFPVDFEVTKSNYWLAVASLILKEVKSDIHVEEITREVDLTPEEQEQYYKFVPPELGGTAVDMNFRAAAQISERRMEAGLLEATLEYTSKGISVFLVVKNNDKASWFAQKLASAGLSIFVIANKHTIDYKPGDKRHYDVIIAPMSQSAGYSIQKIHVMVTGVYFSNQATRSQIEKRINRIGQLEDVTILTVTAGILSYTHLKYSHIKKKNQLIASLAKTFKVDRRDIDF